MSRKEQKDLNKRADRKKSSEEKANDRKAEQAQRDKKKDTMSAGRISKGGEEMDFDLPEAAG